MARRYDLGSVVGKITFDYDKNGIMRARDDMGRFVKNTDDAGTSFDLFSRRGTAAAEKVASSFAHIASSMASVGSGIVAINTLASTITSILPVLGLIPGALAAAGAAATVIALGVDGIKKAFEGLKPTLDATKKAVSSTFEQSLIPAVNNLKDLLPQLTNRFQFVAKAISDVAVNFTAMLRTPAIVNDLNAILNSTGLITRNLGKAIVPLIQAFLDFASVAANSLVGITEGAGAASQRFADWIRQMKDSGKLFDWIEGGVTALGNLIREFVDFGKSIAPVFQAFQASGVQASTAVSASLSLIGLKLGGLPGLIVGSLIPAFSAFAKTDTGQKAIQSLANSLVTVSNVVNTVLVAAFNAIAPILPPLVDAFAQLATQALPILVTALGIVGPILVLIAKALADNMQWIGPLIIGLGLWAAAQWVLNAALDANPIGLVVLALAALVAAVALVITNWDTIVAFFKGIWDAVWKWTSDRITDIRNFIVSTWNQIYKWFSDRLTAIKDFFVGIWNDIVSFFEGIGSKIASAASSVIDWFAALPGKIGSFLSTLPGILWDGFVAAFTFAVNAVIQGVEWIIAAAIALPVRLGQLIRQAGIAIIDGLKNAIQWLITNVPIMIDQVVAFFVALPQRLLDAVVNFAVMLGTWFSNAWTALTTTAATLVTSFVTWVQSLPQKILDALITFGTLLLTWITTAFNTAWDWASQRATEFITWATGLPGRIIAAIQRFVEDARNWAAQAFQALWDAAVQKAAQFLSWVRGLPGQIISILSTLGSKMVSIGGDIVRGIWQGIQDMASWLWNKVTGFVDGIVSKIQSLLDIGSPSKVFADDVGRWIPAGIADGIQKYAGMVTNALADVMAIASPTVDSTFLSTLVATQGTTAPQVTSSNTSSNSNVTIANLNVAGNLDPTNPTQWRNALVSIKDGIRDVERQYV